ncbi:hypothetical protein H6S82_30120 [Planktothrix sp. FACHB-1355]|uniref:Uncharacterized protein n=1 Tax=Aerosakkonema funiforme FACHB-1375 TaxID=2949571 RepID=A0A926ZF26_9CYAN|nr:MULTISPECIES: hypothetical protein [Oscillatoriales]MBD2180234.1 hypothetical protein [Aerosakkonema funiforme FACHB-1375]MBD3563068.1 hypothetical protein [Planktothrix sp. FACHB-1355]
MNGKDSPEMISSIPLKESLLRLSVSPIKADREAIARIERETGKQIQTIIAELDSAEITLKALEEQPVPKYSQLIERIKRASFVAALLGLLGLFLLPENRFAVAIVLGFALGLFAPIRQRKMIGDDWQ